MPPQEGWPADDDRDRHRGTDARRARCRTARTRASANVRAPVLGRVLPSSPRSSTGGARALVTMESRATTGALARLVAGTRPMRRTTRSRRSTVQDRLGRTNSRPGRCPEPRRDGHARHRRRARPLAGVELRQAARFAMTLVTEQAKVCQRLVRLVELGFPELGELFDDPTCRTAREVLRIAPTARPAPRRRTATLANANGGPGHRRLGRRRRSGSRSPRPTRSLSPSSMRRSPSRSACCSTSTTCSSARAPPPTGGSRGSSTA